MMKLCLITGPTSGIGYATSIGIAKLGYKILLLGRNDKKLKQLKSKLLNLGSPNVEYFVVDFTQLDQVHQTVNKITQFHSGLDVVINNAGVYQFRRKLVNGIEMTFLVNHLAHFVLNLGLLPLLRTENEPRIITVASSAHYGVTFNFDDYNREQEYKGFKVYAESKLANILYTYKLTRLLKDSTDSKHITANCLHPGVIRTNIARSVPVVGKIMFRLNPRFKSPSKGAETSIHVATSPETKGFSGNYFVNKQVRKSSTESYNQTAQDQLWTLSEKLTGVKFPENS